MYYYYDDKVELTGVWSRSQINAEDNILYCTLHWYFSFAQAGHKGTSYAHYTANCEDAHGLLRHLGRRLSELSGDVCEVQFLYELISVVVHAAF